MSTVGPREPRSKHRTPNRVAVLLMGRTLLV